MAASTLHSVPMQIRTMPSLLLILFCLLPLHSIAHSVTFVNQCNETIYIGIVQNQGQKLINNGGLRLDAQKNDSVALPFGWSGRFWGRTQCQEWGEMCETGRCGENWMNCLGEFPVSPVTFVDLRLDNQGSGVDFYSVTLVNGYNIPIQVAPVNGTFQSMPGTRDYCTWAGCQNDLNYICPAELQMFGTKGQLVGCRSACDVFQEDEFCCQGIYGTAETCPSFSFADTFKRSCQRAYTYAFDQVNSDYTCLGIDYEANMTLSQKISSGSEYYVTLCPNGEGTSLQWLPESKGTGVWNGPFLVALSALSVLLPVVFL
ncbi:hypothetical protein MPSEU_001045500 [Mayamaea pseudoterrestris]|nr:hypothetical protein MPSEU_001045500 [Mayamaea pseudoterrestris]